MEHDVRVLQVQLEVDEHEHREGDRDSPERDPGDRGPAERARAEGRDQGREVERERHHPEQRGRRVEGERVRRREHQRVAGAGEQHPVQRRELPAGPAAGAGGEHRRRGGLGGAWRGRRRQAERVEREVADEERGPDPPVLVEVEQRLEHERVGEERGERAEVRGPVEEVGVGAGRVRARREAPLREDARGREQQQRASDRERERGDDREDRVPLEAHRPERHRGEGRHREHQVEHPHPAAPEQRLEPARVEVTEQQHPLVEHQAGRPHRRARAEEREQLLGDDQLRLEEQERAEERERAVAEPEQPGLGRGHGRATIREAPERPKGPEPGARVGEDDDSQPRSDLPSDGDPEPPGRRASGDASTALCPSQTPRSLRPRPVPGSQRWTRRSLDGAEGSAPPEQLLDPAEQARAGRAVRLIRGAGPRRAAPRGPRRSRRRWRARSPPSSHPARRR